MTSPATVCPAVKSSDDVGASPVPIPPAAWTLRYPDWAGVTTVTSSSSEETPDAGTPAVPPMRSTVALCAPHGLLGGVRVSSWRCGVTGCSAPGAAAVPAR